MLKNPNSLFHSTLVICKQIELLEALNSWETEPKFDTTFEERDVMLDFEPKGNIPFPLKKTRVMKKVDEIFWQVSTVCS